MGTKKTKSDTSDDGPIKPISYRPSRAVNAAMRAYRERFEYHPDKSAVIERALRAFFRAEGIDLPDEQEG